MDFRTSVAALIGVLIAFAGRLHAEPADQAVVPASHDATSGGAASKFDRVRLVRELMRRRGGDPAAAAQLVQLSREFEPSVAAEMFEELATAHQAAGKIDLAADARLMLVQNQATTPAARIAALWLTRLYASSEVAHMYRSPDATAGDDARQGRAMYAYTLASQFRTTVEGQTPPETSNQPTDHMDARGSTRDPALTFALAVAARQAGLSKPAAAALSPLKHLPAGNLWGDCARMEEWLEESRDGASPKPLGRCTRAASRPRLDGILDDACWQGDAQLNITGSDEKTAAVRLAYDDRFLYLACTCPQAAGIDYASDDRPRPRDADLSQHDRVTIVLDADRDYASAFELTIDSRGWTGERCWDDAAWNPQWFVASRQSETSSPNAHWSVEAAIPWSALAPQPPRAGDFWALSLARQIPGQQPHRWAAPTDATGPARFGVLRFE